VLTRFGQNIPGQVSFTFDTWTSKTGDPFLSVTGHYITAPPDKPNEWQLKNQQLAFAPFEGHHAGSNMSTILVRTVDRYGIRDKVTYYMFVPINLVNVFHAGWLVHCRRRLK
jgi:hypothetical protein